jgi:tetratricopeptide (TPR) repeat protein
MERQFKQAMAAEDQGDLDSAESILSKLHAAHPGNFAVDESLGLLYVQRQDCTRALPLLESAATVQPSSDVAHANLGAALYELHLNKRAELEFERAAHLNPSNESALQSLGRVLMDEHRPADAARALKAALSLKSNDPDLQLDCATALLAAKQPVDARKILTDFTNADHSARAQALMGEADEQTTDFASAAKHFTRAVELEPSEENAWLLGEELLRHWTFSAAAVEFEAASAKFPDSKRMRLGLGAALFGDAKYAKAIPVFADLLESDPDNADYAGMLGVSCTTVMEETSPQCAALVRYAQVHPADAKASAYAAASLLGQSDSQSQKPLARKLLESALAADPKLPEAQFQMGTFLQDDGMWKESIPYLERAVALKPDFSQAHYHLALAYWRTGRKQDGQTEMELQKKFSKQQQQDLDQRLRQITTFIVDVPK